MTVNPSGWRPSTPDKVTPADEPGQTATVTGNRGLMLEEPLLANTWERDDRGEHTRAVVEAIDPETMGIDPLTYL